MIYDAQDIGDFLYDLVEKIIKNKNWKIKEIINQILKMKRTHPIEVADRILKSPKLIEALLICGRNIANFSNDLSWGNIL